MSDTYRAEWAEWVSKNADHLYMGTKAEHRLGDVSRDEPDIFIAREETGRCYIGEWLTGFGFVNVVFPKSTSRPLTDEEIADLAERPVVIV